MQKQNSGRLGRLLVRKSGTESLVRLMAQGDNEQMLHEVIDDLSEAIYLKMPIKRIHNL